MKKLSAIFISSCLILFCGGCGRVYEGPPADLVIKNTNIITIDSDNSRAEAMAVKDEFIIAVTTNDKVDQYIEEGTTTVIDARGRLVIPGLNDAHIHFMGSGQSMMQLDFRYVHDVQTILQMVTLRGLTAMHSRCPVSRRIHKALPMERSLRTPLQENQPGF